MNNHLSSKEVSHSKPITEAVKTAPEQVAPKPDVPLLTTLSGRVSKKPLYLQDYVGYETSIFDDTSYDFTKGVDMVALMMSTSQDILYFHDILRERAGRDQKSQTR
jgi:hypothetical protein